MQSCPAPCLSGLGAPGAALQEENKTIALSTSKLNYLDPRISVAWCKRHEVPVEKVYNTTQRAKFRWAIEMATKDFVF